MNGCYEIELRGCTPEPLMAYLKALGIFRLVSEQKDSSARAWWQNDSFILRTALERDGLVEFFVNEYRPMPIVSPWNGGSGFHPRDNSKAMEKIREQDSPRFRLWHEVMAKAEQVMFRSGELQGAERKDPKRWILAQCRAQFPDDALAWLDATYVLTSGGVKYPPLLGTGGNDGRLEFSNNFMQNIVLALDLDHRRNGEAIARNQLIAALFNEGSPHLVRKRSTGFYNPSSVGGANATVGFNDDALTNPWDYVLTFEGAMLFAGAAARRLSAQASSNAVYPFTTDSSAAGYGTSVDSEYGDSSRAEFWAPLWDHAANRHELEHLVSEGRAQLGRRQVSSGTDFARAVAGLGTERGITQFQRYGFLERNGRAYLAAPLGRFHVRRDQGTVRGANVLFDLNAWMDSMRRNVSAQNAPAGLGVALSQIESAIIEFCQKGRPEDLQNVLIAVGHAERWLSNSGLRKDNEKGKGVRPLDRLSTDWLRHANDGSPEFLLARAMASILHEPASGETKIGSVRENMDPVDTSGRTSWKEDSTSFVWSAGDPLDNMLAVLERRCLEGRMRGLSYPPLASGYSARLDDVVEFIDGNIDIQRVADLAFPLSFVRYWHRAEGEAVQGRRAPFDLPIAYAAMKLTLLTEKFVSPEFNADTDVWMEPQMLSMLRAGRIDNAYKVAWRRLRASGLRPLSGDSGIANGSEHGRRLAAALLFPFDEYAHCALAERAVRKPHRTESQDS